MKNLLIYIHPSKTFYHRDWGEEPDRMIKIQIDNSLLYWKKEDILLVTNFEYEYSGVKAIVVGDNNYWDKKIPVSKINAILELFEKGLIKDELYWFHDLDAFQNGPLGEVEGEFCLTEYGKTNIRPSYDFRLSTGSIFFRKSARDIFKLMRDRSYAEEINEESSLGRIVKERPEIDQRITRLNITYNFATRRRDLMRSYAVADKPLKVIHFHPFDRREVYNGKPNIEVLIRGENEEGVLLSENLLKIFKKHGIQ